MPYITVESGALSNEQKELLIRRLTEAPSEIMKVPQEFWVTTIKEVSDKNFGIGGKTIDNVKEEYIKNHKWLLTNVRTIVQVWRIIRLCICYINDNKRKF